MPKEELFDVAIVGAGPGGCTAALGLARAGHSVLLIDKTDFPRHKVCGDAIPNNAMRMLQRHYPDVEQRLRSEVACSIEGYEAYWKGLRIARGSWPMQAINAARKSFDNVLFEAAIQEPNCQLAAPHRIHQLQRQSDQTWMLIDTQNTRFRAKAIVLSHGANGDFRNQVGLPTLNKSHWGVAGSQYCQLPNMPKRNLFFIPKGSKIPGYFWIFPVDANTCNVGFGVISNKPVKLKQLYEEVCTRDSSIAKILSGSKALSTFQGHKIPIPQKPLLNSAPGVLFIGDAAELVDPLYGHGIDKAIISGHWAAEALINGFATGHTQSYPAFEQNIKHKLWPEMRKSYRRMKSLSYALKLLP